MMSRLVKRFKWLSFLLLLVLTGCFVRDIRWTPIRPVGGGKPVEYKMITTGYCKCGSCCGWERNWYGRPVIDSGPRKGEAKRVGIAASGARAKPGTIAADGDLFPFGTVVYVPGYGYGVVEDRGSDIKGYHLDLYFTSHSRAMTWGKQPKVVKVWKP